MSKIIREIEIQDEAMLRGLFGDLDINAKTIEDEMGVSMGLRNGKVHLEGQEELVSMAEKLVDQILTVVGTKGFVTKQELEYMIHLTKEKKADEIENILDEVILTTAYGRPLRPKTLGQKRYCDSIRENGIIFGIGPAGTGKTYLAMAMAISAFKNREVNRIILTRPAVEAGESLGFLPGDLQEKIDPYLRPLYDALFEMMGHDAYLKLMEKGQIEVAPLAYMRGRTLDNSFIVLDEAQNTSPEQMKMFLTRLGYGSKAVITGDITQVDLPRGRRSGLITIRNILEGVEGIDFVDFTRHDVVRHPLVQRIIDAYERYEKKMESKR